MDYDIIIIGAGAAGLSAAIYTCRKKLKTAVISIDVGGQTNLTNHIENYPGVAAKPGPDLMQDFQKQAAEFGAEFIYGKAKKIDKIEGGFRVNMTSDEREQYTTKVLILTFGKVPRQLGIPGEEKFFGRGVSTCATCDAPLFKNKVAAVVGGGNSALEAALELTSYATKVYLIHRRDQFRGDEITQEKIKKNSKIQLILNSIPVEVKGDKFVSGMVVEHVESKERSEYQIHGLFLEIGSIVDTSMVQGLVKTNEKKEIIADGVGKTSCAGIFAAGDVTQTPYKQTVIAAGDGARAALEAYSYITGSKPTLDWTH